MGEWDHNRIVQLVAPADALCEAGDPQKAANREAADGNDHRGPHDAELPVTPELAQRLLARRRCSVTATRWRATGVTPRHRSAVERRIELVFVELEPATERSPGTSAPRAPLFAFHDAGRLAVHVGALVDAVVADRPGLEWEAGFDARSTH